jgi:hypothetical protein
MSLYKSKYPKIIEYITNIKDKDKFVKNIESIIEANGNIIHIVDYEVTTKISYYYLNYDTPVSRNSNTISVKTNYASYIYDITTFILFGLNKYQYFSQGEFTIHSSVIIELVNELNEFIEDICKTCNSDDELVNLKESIKNIVDMSLDMIDTSFYELELSDNYKHNIKDNLVLTLSER